METDRDKKGMSLIELIVNTVIGVILLTSVVLVLVWITKMQFYFRTRTANDMSWVAANEHLKKHIHSASYVEISGTNSDTLTLYDYSGIPTGTYTNAAAINNTPAGLKFDTDNITFENVAATYERIHPPLPAIKVTEIRVNYTAPAQVASSVALRCGVDATNTWALVIGGTQEDYPMQIIQTSDHNYVVAGYTKSFGAGNYDIYLMKISRDGTKLWSSTYGTGGADMGLCVCETLTAAGGASSGFAIAGTSAGVNAPVLILTDQDGAPLTSTGFEPKYYTYSEKFGSVSQIFNSNTGQPLGYVLSSYDNSFAGLWRLNTNGTVNWVRQITYTNASHQGIMDERLFCAKQVFSAIGATNGYIAGGETYKYWNNSYDSVVVVRVNDAGTYQWSRMYTRQTFSNKALYVDRIYTAAGAPNGFIIGGEVDRNTGGYNQDPFLIRINDDATGSMIWPSALVFPNHGGSIGDTFSAKWMTGDEHTLSATTSETILLYGYTIAAPRAYLVNVSDGGIAGEPFFFNFPYRTISAYVTSTDSNGNFDGYILLGTYSPSGKPGLGNPCFFIVKTDTNGNCPEANDVNLMTYIPDAPASHTISYTKAGGTSAKIDLNNVNNHPEGI